MLVDVFDKMVIWFNGFVETGSDDDFYCGDDPYDRFFV